MQATISVIHIYLYIYIHTLFCVHVISLCYKVRTSPEAMQSSAKWQTPRPPRLEVRDLYATSPSIVMALLYSSSGTEVIQV